MMYKTNSSKRILFQNAKGYKSNICSTLYYLLPFIGWNSSPLTTLGKSCYIFHKIWVLVLFWRWHLVCELAVIGCIPVAVSSPMTTTSPESLGSWIREEKVFIENICKRLIARPVQVCRLTAKYKLRNVSFTSSKFTGWKPHFFISFEYVHCFSEYATL